MSAAHKLVKAPTKRWLCVGTGKAVHIKVQELIWGEPLPWGGDGAAFDLILGSDLCYDSDLFPPLLNTICQLIAHNPAAQVYAFPQPPPPPPL